MKRKVKLSEILEYLEEVPSFGPGEKALVRRMVSELQDIDRILRQCERDIRANGLFEQGDHGRKVSPAADLRIRYQIIVKNYLMGLNRLLAAGKLLAVTQWPAFPPAGGQDEKEDVKHDDRS